jgi:hypothetical protein
MDPVGANWLRHRAQQISILLGNFDFHFGSMLAVNAGMLPDSNPSSAIWTIASLVILFGMIPAILFLLGRAASAGTQPDSEQMDEAKQLAIQINQASEALLTEASQAFVGAPGERQALDSLIRFADSAEGLRIALLSPARSPSRGRKAFRDLMMDFELARLSFPALRAYRTGLEKMERLEMVIEELKVLYDARPGEPSARKAAHSAGAKKAERHDDILNPP